MNTLSAIHAASALLQRLAVVDATERTSAADSFAPVYGLAAESELRKVAEAMGFTVSRFDFGDRNTRPAAAEMLAAQMERS